MTKICPTPGQGTGAQCKQDQRTSVVVSVKHREGRRTGEARERSQGRVRAGGQREAWSKSSQQVVVFLCSSSSTSNSTGQSGFLQRLYP